mmetsp:Transcript_25421/g.22437  ORF Transcript_25421/g.22437 Transcript_25421/m.22437 type:complete len:80 (-) Transcript_25421:1142-1381(-)
MKNHSSSHSQSTDSKPEGLKVLKMVSQQKFGVYLAYADSVKAHVAMKVFPYSEDNEPSINYENEKRFSFLKHPNIIAPL